MFNEYQQNAITTMTKPELGYTLRGIAGETGEVLNKIWFTRTSTDDLELELGDVFWYCATSAHLMNRQFSEVCRSPIMNVFDLDTTVKMLAVAVLQLMEISKKIDRDGLTTEKEAGILDIIGDVTAYIRYIGNFYKLDTRHILDRNIYKLKSRKARNQIHGDGDFR